MWVKRELLYALEESRFANRIASVLFEDCPFRKLSWVLSQYQLIDFRTDQEAGLRELFKVWGIGYRPG